MNFKEDIEEFQPLTPQESSEKDVILDFIKKNKSDVLFRKNKIAHLTASAMIFNENMDKVLMIYHNIYMSWSWTGGHADGDEDLLHVAMKEACEETGLKMVKALSQNIVSLDIIPVFNHKKNKEYIPSHLHLSVAYALQASEEDPLFIKPDENSGVQWILIDKLDEYIDEPELLLIYKKMIERVRGLILK